MRHAYCHAPARGQWIADYEGRRGFHLRWLLISDAYGRVVPLFIMAVEKVEILGGALLIRGAVPLAIAALCFAEVAAEYTAAILTFDGLTEKDLALGIFSS